MGRPTPQTLPEVLANITDPRRWADFDALVEVMTEVPSVRGMVYGNVAEIEFREWLVGKGVPLADQVRDDDHAKTKSDRTIVFQGRRFTIQMKSLQTNSLRERPAGVRGARAAAVFTGNLQCDASDRRTVTLSTGTQVETTCYVAGEFDILAVGLHPFLGEWDFAFRLNSTLPRSTRSTKPTRHLTAAERSELLKTLVDFEWPIPKESDWTMDLFGLLAGAPDLGEAVEVDEDTTVVRLPGSRAHVVVEE